VTFEIVLMWIAVTMYAVSSILYVFALVFDREWLARGALWASIAGLVPHAVAIAVRWVQVGHGPYLGFYEVVSSYAFFSVLVLAILTWRYRSLQWAGVVVMPIAFLLLGAAMLAPKAGMDVSGTLASWWLTIHVTFAKLSYSWFIASFALALVYLVRDRGVKGRWEAILSKLPSQETIDDLIFKCVGAGFLFLTIMIVTGAIWANEAWGRYWAWDPIETWSLISWFVYAAYLHLRLALGWRGRRSAWVAVGALPLVAFAIMGVPLVYSSIHGAYLGGVPLKGGTP
jgi:cytochrome c-type biogenesis protein CcsB